MRLLAAFRFDTREVFIRPDPETGDVILSRKPADRDGFLAVLKEADIPADFLGPSGRGDTGEERDPFAGWSDAEHNA